MLTTQLSKESIANRIDFICNNLDWVGFGTEKISVCEGLNKPGKAKKYLTKTSIALEVSGLWITQKKKTLHLLSMHVLKCIKYYSGYSDFTYSSGKNTYFKNKFWLLFWKLPQSSRFLKRHICITTSLDSKILQLWNKVNFCRLEKLWSRFKDKF